jgi:hypothetical protein
MFLQNVVIYLQVYTALQPRRRASTLSVQPVHCDGCRWRRKLISCAWESLVGWYTLWSMSLRLFASLVGWYTLWSMSIRLFASLVGWYTLWSMSSSLCLAGWLVHSMVNESSSLCLAGWLVHSMVNESSSLCLLSCKQTDNTSSTLAVLNGANRLELYLKIMVTVYNDTAVMK